MGTFLNNYRNVLKALIITLLAVLLLNLTLVLVGIEQKRPYEYGDSVWKCSEPNIELIYEGEGKKCVYYSPDGEVELDVGFDNAGRLYIVYEGRSNRQDENILFKGDCKFDSDFFVVEVIRNELFDGDYDELIFERIE